MNLTLPLSPSMNSYWVHKVIPGQRHASIYVSPEGKQFARDVRACVLKQIGQHKPLTGRLSVRVVIHPEDKRDIDLDNRIKATFDALTKAGVWVDDEQIDRFTVERGAIIPTISHFENIMGTKTKVIDFQGGRCEVRIAVIVQRQEQKELFAEVSSE